MFTINTFDVTSMFACNSKAEKTRNSQKPQEPAAKRRRVQFIPAQIQTSKPLPTSEPSKPLQLAQTSKPLLLSQISKPLPSSKPLQLALPLPTSESSKL